MVERFGRELFNALFPDNIKTLYGMTWQAANDREKGVRLKLRVQASELVVVPGEGVRLDSHPLWPCWGL